MRSRQQEVAETNWFASEGYCLPERVRQKPGLNQGLPQVDWVIQPALPRTKPAQILRVEGWRHAVVGQSPVDQPLGVSSGSEGAVGLKRKRSSEIIVRLKNVRWEREEGGGTRAQAKSSPGGVQNSEDAKAGVVKEGCGVVESGEDQAFHHLDGVTHPRGPKDQNRSSRLLHRKVYRGENYEVWAEIQARSSQPGFRILLYGETRIVPLRRAVQTGQEREGHGYFFNWADHWDQRWREPEGLCLRTGGERVHVWQILQHCFHSCG